MGKKKNKKNKFKANHEGVVTVVQNAKKGALVLMNKATGVKDRTQIEEDRKKEEQEKAQEALKSQERIDQAKACLLSRLVDHELQEGTPATNEVDEDAVANKDEIFTVDKKVVRFQSKLDFEGVIETSKTRIPEFEKLTGLIQKYYTQTADGNRIAGIYVWDCEDSLEKFRASELAASIPQVYQIIGPPEIETYEVAYTLRNHDKNNPH